MEISCSICFLKEKSYISTYISTLNQNGIVRSFKITTLCNILQIKFLDSYSSPTLVCCLNLWKIQKFMTLMLRKNPSDISLPFFPYYIARTSKTYWSIDYEAWHTLTSLLIIFFLDQWSDHLKNWEIKSGTSTWNYWLSLGIVDKQINLVKEGQLHLDLEESES